MTDTDPRAIVETLWRRLYEKDFDAVGAFFAPDGEYTDVPTPADDVARGPEQIAARLRVGLEPLASIGHTVRTLLVDGDTVMTEHVEHWGWPTGERVDLPFVSIHELRDGQIVRWWDYWDLGTLMGAAPAWWVEHIMAESARVGLREP
ncbi:MAG TPA: nuclear transport factor 2 family protein [Acidimicrobiia bacterium]|nr:nuclear transport factor 2 family protein [Acidimicrobiia bacterium]